MGQRQMPGIHQVEELIRAGDLHQARRALASLGTRRLSRLQRLEIARLSRRAGAPNRAIKLLFQVVRGSGRKSSAGSTPEEKAEFAASLIRIGAVREARNLLQSIPSIQGNQAGLFLAFSMMHEWDYVKAVPLLQSYLKEVPSGDYTSKVAAVNLAAALVSLHHHEEAEQVLEELRSRTRAEGLRLLWMNSLELSAQNELSRGKLKKARRFIEQSAELARSAQGSSDSLYIEKWRAIIRLQESGADPAAVDEVMRVRAKAEACREYEVVRDCDLQLAKRTGDQGTLERLYFGTPYESYRSLVLSECRRFGIELPPLFEEKIGAGTKGAALNVSTGVLTGPRKAALKPGQVPHRLLIAMARDFYKPPRIAEIFGQVFPQQHFNPFTSPKSVHQALKRLREWFDEAGIPMDIPESGFRYRLAVDRECSVTLVLTRDLGAAADSGAVKRAHYLAQIEKRFSGDPFNAVRVAETLSFPLRTAQLLLKEMVQAGSLIRQGNGRSTSYRVAQHGSVP